MHSLDRHDVADAALGHLSDLAVLLARVPREPLARAVEALLTAREQGRRVYVLGNGGSAATANHVVCDLVKSAQVPGFRPLRAFALADGTALMSAFANDVSYAETFPRMLEALAEPDDVVIAISASGNSPNIVRGLEAANRLGARTIALVGFDGGAALAHAEIAVHVPSHDYGLVEDVHSALGHALTAAIRRALEGQRDRSVLRMLDESPILPIEAAG